MKAAFSRSASLLGDSAMAKLDAANVLVVGVGGVGSWAAEALVRTGLGTIVLMDDDVVAESNLNRQCPALTATLGQPKVDAMGERLAAINSDCRVGVIADRYRDGSRFSLDGYDLVIDAIDSVADKAALILSAQYCRVPILSSMGAALRRDPTRVRITQFEKVSGDGLAKALRQRFRRLGRHPDGFRCVWSSEPPQRSTARGSLMPVTAAFGMALAAAAIEELTTMGTKS